MIYYTLEGKVSDDCSLEDGEEHRPFFLCYLQLSQEGVTRGFIHVAVIISQQPKIVQLDDLCRLSWICTVQLMEGTRIYQQSFFNSLLYWEPWTPDAKTLELPAVKKAGIHAKMGSSWREESILTFIFTE